MTLTSSLRNILQRAIANKVFPGCVVGMLDRVHGHTCIAVGHHRYDSASPMRVDDVFDVASVTKLVPTATLALQLIDRKVIALDTPVVHFLPELSTERASQLTVFHLLTHTVDFGIQLSSLKDHPPRQILEKLLGARPVRSPGSSFCYANATSLLLGMLIERATGGEPLDRIAQRELFDPLGMDDTTFHPASLARQRFVPTERDPWRTREIVGEIHDESAWRLREVMIPGSAGLFSTAADLLSYLGMLLNRGMVGERPILSPWAIDALQTNQIAHLDASTGLGCELNQPRYMGSHAAHTIGKTGFTGCVLMCNHNLGKALVLLSNATWPTRHPDRQPINAVRAQVADLVFAAAD